MTAIVLKDAPGGAQLIEALTAAAKGLSLANANTPDDTATNTLSSFARRCRRASRLRSAPTARR